MNSQRAFRISAALGFLAVALGAFGAHKLHDILVQNGRLDTWQTAVLYQFVHTVMMCFLAVSGPFRKGPWFCFLIGILIFSGSLYVLALTNATWLGAITPLGGVAFLVGWGWLVIQGKGSGNREPGGRQSVSQRSVADG